MSKLQSTVSNYEDYSDRYQGSLIRAHTSQSFHLFKHLRRPTEAPPPLSVREKHERRQSIGNNGDEKGFVERNSQHPHHRPDCPSFENVTLESIMI